VKQQCFARSKKRIAMDGRSRQGAAVNRWIFGWSTLIAGTLLTTFVHGQENLSLAGIWRLQLDREDVGARTRWFEGRLEQQIRLPGALQNQGFGDDISVSTDWRGETNLDLWMNDARYENYRKPGNLKVPFGLQPQKHYTGAAWYQRDVEIPSGWKGKRIVLTIERAH